MTRMAPLLLAAALLTAAPSAAETQSSLADAATAFLKSLDADQRAKAQMAFDSDERLNWFFIPKERLGLRLKHMTPAQQKAALHLVRTGLSEKGFSKAEAVRALEPVLAALENDPVRRDRELYYVSIFGDPSAAGTWGMRWEGHHLSLHWTMVEGKAIATTPQFFGSNPAEVRSGPKKGTRVLAAEEDLGRALVKSLTDEQRAAAIISDTAPSDILTSNARKAAMQEDKGLGYAAMTEKQRGLLISLLEEYASAQPQKLAQERLAKVRAAGLDRVKFAWMGGIEKGDLHYYRVQGPTFLVEYDSTQNEGNHIHAVWRDFTGDFGLDLLEEHYRTSSHHKP